MRIVIIEDEQLAYKRLNKMVNEVKPEAVTCAHLDSVAMAREWFENNDHPDLVFMDIHLADGSGFDLLDQVNIKCPVIFTTAYDQYAMEAFRTNSIDYLLKPVKKEELEAAFEKLQNLKSFFSDSDKSKGNNPLEYKKRFLIRYGEHIKTLLVEEIAYCFSENKGTFARTFDNRTYPMDHNLDALETMLDPQDYFRINRQFLISLKAIDEMKTYTKARVIIRLKPAVKEPPVVSSERAADFKLWLAGEL